MRFHTFVLRAIFGLSLLSAVPALAQESPLIPERRFVLFQDVDLPGGDLSSIFDTTLDACQRACLSQTQCDAFTFNARSNSCFIKQGAGTAEPFSPAWSGRVVTANPGAEALAQTRMGDLTFLPYWDIDAAVYQARDMANAYVTNDWTAEELMASAAEQESNGDLDAAFRFAGAAVNLSDSAYDWSEFARLVLLAAGKDSNNASYFQGLAFNGAINAYLRANDKALQTQQSF